MTTRRVVFAAIISMLAGTAHAGLYLPVPVEVDLEKLFAQGDQVRASRGKPNEMSIACGTRVLGESAGSATSLGFCEATDADGDTVSCTTVNPSFVNAISTMSVHSFIAFSWDEDTRKCTRVSFSTRSSLPPKSILYGRK